MCLGTGRTVTHCGEGLHCGVSQSAQTASSELHILITYKLFLDGFNPVPGHP